MAVIVGGAFAFLLLALVALVAAAGQSMVLAGVAIGFAVLTTLVTIAGARAVGTWSIMGALFLAPMDDLRPGGESLVTFSDLAFALGFALLAPTMLRRRAHIPALFVIGAAGLVATTIIATLLADNWIVSISFALRMIAAVILLPLAYAWWGPSTRLIDLLAWSYIAGQCVSTVYALVDGTVVGGRYLGLTTHMNFFGMGGMVAVALALYLWPRAVGGQRWLVLAAGAISFYGVILSGSRAATIAILVLVVLYPVVEKSAVSMYLVVAGGVAGAIALNWLVEFFGPTSVFARLVPGDFGAGLSDQARTMALELYWGRFLARPVTGEGFLGEQYDAHNVYLQVAVAIGIFGLLSFVILGWSLMRPLFEGGPRRGLAYMAVAYATIAPLTPSIWDRNIWAGLGLAILATAPDRSVHKRKNTLERGRRGRSPSENRPAPGTVREPEEAL